MYVLYVLTIALANLALGYGTAVRVRRNAALRTPLALDAHAAIVEVADLAVSAPAPTHPHEPAANNPAPPAPSKSRSALLTAAASHDIDAPTSVIHRAEFDGLLTRWRQDDPVQERSATLGLISIDQLAGIRQQHGDSVADLVCEELENLIDDTVRKPRGTDTAARYDRERFSFFFGDTTPQEAIHAIERIRSSIAQGRFVIGRETLVLTASCGVAGLLRDEADESLFARLEFAARQASTLGGNRTCLDAGHGPVPVDPITVEVPERTVILQA